MMKGNLAFATIMDSGASYFTWRGQFSRAEDFKMEVSLTSQQDLEVVELMLMWHVTFDFLPFRTFCIGFGVCGRRQ